MKIKVKTVLSMNWENTPYKVQKKEQGGKKRFFLIRKGDQVYTSEAFGDCVYEMFRIEMRIKNKQLTLQG